MGKKRRSNLLGGFDEAWDAYRTLCRGKLIEKRRQGALSAAAATMAIRTAEGPWDDPHSTCGSWLEEVRAHDARAAERVSAAIRDFSFIAVPMPPARPSSGEVAAVTIGGAVALGAASTAVGQLLGTGPSATLPLVGAGAGAILAGSMATGVRAQGRRRADADLLNAYLEQLDLLREEIAGIVDDA